MSFEQDGIKQIDAKELKNIIKTEGKKDCVIIDVRETEEYERGHIPGVPLLPMHSIPALIEGFDKNKEYVFLCRSGNRSQNVSLYMKENGFDKVTNYNGGMLSWDGDIKSGPEHHVETVEELKKLK